MKYLAFNLFADITPLMKFIREKTIECKAFLPYFGKSVFKQIALKLWKIMCLVKYLKKQLE